MAISAGSQMAVDSQRHEILILDIRPDTDKFAARAMGNPEQFGAGARLSSRISMEVMPWSLV